MIRADWVSGYLELVVQSVSDHPPLDMTETEKTVCQIKLPSLVQNLRSRSRETPKNNAVDDPKWFSASKKYRLLRCAGCVLLLLGTVTYTTDPIEHLQEWGMRVTPGSRFFEMWKEPPLNIFTNVYIFNVTNPDTFLQGKEKLRVQEVGPFVFRETLRNTNVKFNGNNTMTYTPRRSVQFLRGPSVADPSALRVIVPNIALLGLGSMLAESSMLTNLGLLSAIKYIGSKPFLNMTVHDYLWGYEDPLVEMAHTVVRNWIPFAKLGLLDRMYDEGDNSITIRLADNGLPVTDPGYLPQYSIDNWNGSPGLHNWGYHEQDYCHREEPLRPKKTERCQLIRGATEGILFPRHLNPLMRSYVYRKSFCRTMPIEFKHRGSFMPGIVGDWYGLPDNVFDIPENNPEQLCYCDPNQRTCLPKGLADITPCYYNIPAAVSFPHFYGGDPSLVQQIDGLAPKKELHGSHAVLQPDLGSVVDFNTRIQTNLVIKNIRYNSDLIPLANMYIPFFWVEMTTDGLPVDMVIMLYVLLVVLPALQTLVIATGVVSAIGLIAAMFYHLYKSLVLSRIQSLSGNNVLSLVSLTPTKVATISPG